MNDKDISIEVHQGVVTLTGTVQNWMKWEAVERNAYEGGAKDVINNTVIRIHSLQSAKN